MISLFGPGKKSHEQAAEAAKADLEAAAKALEGATKAQATALEKLGGEVDALAASFAETGDSETAQKLSVARSTLDEVKNWHLSKIEELTRAKAEAEERHRVTSATATAARLLGEAVTRAKTVGVRNKIIESALAAIRKVSLPDLKGAAFPELKEGLVRSEVERLLPEVLGAESDIAALVQIGIKSYGNGADGIAKGLNVNEASLTDDRQFEFYEMTERSVSEFLEAVRGVLADLRTRRAENEKQVLRKEKERVAAEEAQRVADQRAAIAIELEPELARLEEVAEPFINHLTPEHALRSIAGLGRNDNYAHDARARLIAARGHMAQDGKPKPHFPDDLAWDWVLARRGLLWKKRPYQSVSEDARIIDDQLSVEWAMDRLIDRELKERRKAAA